MDSGIYKITNPKGKIYVGSTENIHIRKRFYQSILCKSQTKIFNSLRKYGWENHSFEILEECTFENLYPLERAWGMFYNVLDEKTGLNLKLPGNGESKGLVSNETKERMSESKKGILFSEIHLLNLSTSHKGKLLSEETKLKMSLAAKGRKVSDDVRANMSRAQKGRKVSEETKMKLSNALKGRKLSEEHRLKLVEIMKNRPPVSDEVREKLSKPRSEQARLNMSLAAKKRYDKNITENSENSK